MKLVGWLVCMYVIYGAGGWPGLMVVAGIFIVWVFVRELGHDKRAARADALDPEPIRAHAMDGGPWKDWDEYSTAHNAWNRRQTIRDLDARPGYFAGIIRGAIRGWRESAARRKAAQAVTRAGDQRIEALTESVELLASMQRELENKVDSRLQREVDDE